MQLQEIIPLRSSQECSAIAVTRFNGFQIKNVVISKRMVHSQVFGRSAEGFIVTAVSVMDLSST